MNPRSMKPPGYVYNDSPPSPARHDHCGNCVFFSPEQAPGDLMDGSTEDWVEGNCYRYPPVPKPAPNLPSHMRNLMVRVESIQWCGEHKRREDQHEQRQTDGPTGSPACP